MATRTIVNTRVSPGLYRTSTGALTRTPTQNAIPRTQPTPAVTNGTTAARPLGMAGGQYRGADRTAFYAGQTAGAGAMAPSTFRGAQRRAYQAGQGTNPVVTTQPVPEQQPTPQAEQAPAPAAAPAAEVPMYRPANDFLPADITASPLYNWRMQQANDALNKRLSAMGLTGSGREISDAVGIANQISGEETDKMMGYAQREADRFSSQQENEATRAYGREGRAWDNQFRLTDLMLSQNPMQYAYQGLGSYANYLNSMGQNNAGFIGDNYARISGGGGGSAPVFQPPMASGPNSTQSNLYGAGTQSNSINNLLNLGAQLYGMYQGSPR